MSSLLLGSRFEVVIPEVRGKSKTTEHNLIFGNKIAGRGSLKQRSGLPISDFPALPDLAQARLVCLSFGADESCLDPDICI